MLSNYSHYPNWPLCQALWHSRTLEPTQHPFLPSPCRLCSPDLHLHRAPRSRGSNLSDHTPLRPLPFPALAPPLRPFDPASRLPSPLKQVSSGHWMTLMFPNPVGCLIFFNTAEAPAALTVSYHHHHPPSRLPSYQLRYSSCLDCGALRVYTKAESIIMTLHTQHTASTITSGYLPLHIQPRNIYIICFHEISIQCSSFPIISKMSCFLLLLQIRRTQEIQTGPGTSPLLDQHAPPLFQFSFLPFICWNKICIICPGALSTFWFCWQPAHSVCNMSL